MKVLHTADWHIGKILHKHALKTEIQSFFNWLLYVISQEHVNLLLVSGDIFDLANPSAKDRETYYHFLSKLAGTGTQIIITGGNHDSINLLDAPKELLYHLSINIVGGAKVNIEDELIEIHDAQGKLVLVVAAVPFLRDKDLRNINTDMKFKNREEAVREGIKLHYQKLAEICESKYKNIPTIAMGHLYAKGSITSDSEREIQVGNQAAVESNIFSPIFDYVALGHIHKPQVIGKNEKIRYSGSPIALSFSEKEDSKTIILLDIKAKDDVEVKPILIPKQRELKKFKGSLKEVQEKLKKYNPEFNLSSFVELEIEEETYSSSTIAAMEEMVSEYVDQDNFKILKNKISFEKGQNNTADLFTQGEHIEDLTPIEVFNKKLESEEIDAEKSKILQDAFLEILELVESED